MTLRQEMLQAARQAPQLLGESTPLVEGFFRGQQNSDGGFKDRTGRSDLYYTVFGLHGLIALGAKIPLEPILNYLGSFGSGEGLDFVHLCCLARCWAAVQDLQPSNTKPAFPAPPILSTLNSQLSTLNSTVYDAFLAVGAYQDLNEPLPEPQRLGECLERLATPDGAWANERGLDFGSTNATAAAVALARHLNLPVPPTAAPWLLARVHPQGGFLAAPQAPMPDLLSTATALHALGGLGVPVAPVREGCLDFLDSLWTNAGGFHGHWADDHLDGEYTFYALMALGHLAG
jgi:hypothetical protein